MYLFLHLAVPAKVPPPACRSVSFPDEYTQSSMREGINWEWGMSGEQEWTPEMKTGITHTSVI